MAAPTVYKDLEVVSFNNPDAFDEWLAKNYKRTEGFWLRYYKKHTGKESIVHGDAVDVALCWGWIDGLLNRYDEESYVVRFTPRRAKSVWSQVNVAKVEKLIASGRMKPSGLALIDEAKADGRWAKAYPPQSTMRLPSKFTEQLKTSSDAQKTFETLTKAQVYAIAYKLHHLKTTEALERNIAKYIADLADGKKPS